MVLTLLRSSIIFLNVSVSPIFIFKFLYKYCGRKIVARSNDTFLSVNAYAWYSSLGIRHFYFIKLFIGGNSVLPLLLPYDIILYISVSIISE